jgi:O-methyltransferase involved in polyketide biosynthesis
MTMRRNQPSFSASGIAAVGALESEKSASERVCHDTLRFVAEHSGSGSSIVFDYMCPSLLASAPRHGEVRDMRRYRWLIGEQLAFGIPEGAVTAFVEQRGFYRVKNADHVVLYWNRPISAIAVRSGP